MDRCCSSLLCLGCVRLFVGWFDMRRLCLVVVIVLGVVLRCGGFVDFFSLDLVRAYLVFKVGLDLVWFRLVVCVF